MHHRKFDGIAISVLLRKFAIEREKFFESSLSRLSHTKIHRRYRIYDKEQYTMINSNFSFSKNIDTGAALNDVKRMN